ncbi:hypothetical protein [uncultured Pantoea sp.]|uniref:hypothetical protein n=1 Tax=uncultured Pantoea sp. TaxID=218084 RepID=UPI002587E4CE|nr:hypothetical protein [uncultured Pantoea sp.]
MVKNTFKAFRMKNLFSLLILEGAFILLCIPVGVLCGRLNLSDNSIYGIIVAYVFLSMTAVPFIHRRFILKERK